MLITGVKRLLNKVLLIMNLSFLVNKIHNRLIREYLYLPVVSNLARKNYHQKLSKYKSQLPNLNHKNREIFNTLQQDGVCVTTVDNLSNPQITGAVNAAKDLLLKSPLNSPTLTQEIGCQGNYGVPGKILQNYPEILLWGLNEQLLDLVENYIGLPIFYLGAEVKRCFPDGGFTGVRNWHTDTEDYRMFKVIIYLNDVDEQGGPFQYIPEHKSDIAKKKLKYRFGLISDQLMEKHVSSQDWVSCLGKKNTVIIADTFRIFHRAKPPINQERLSITLTYLSQHAVHLRNNDLSISTAVEHLCKNLSQRQLKCLVSL